MHGRRELSTVLSLGGIPVGLPDEPRERVPPALLPFTISDGSPRLVARGHLGALPALDGKQVLFDSGGTWRVDAGRDPGAIRLVLRAGPHPGQPYQVLSFDAGLERADVVLDAALLLDEPTPFLLRAPALELWITFLLLRGRGLLLHGCGLLAGGRVRVFVGESGAGKSTLAGLLARQSVGSILSDDRLVVRPEGDGYRVWGTPWHGEARFASPQQGPLATIYFLRHASETRLTALPPAEAGLRLAGVCFQAGWPRDGLAHLLDQCARMATSVPCFELAFRPDASVLAALDLAG